MVRPASSLALRLSLLALAGCNLSPTRSAPQDAPAPVDAPLAVDAPRAVDASTRDVSLDVPPIDRPLAVDAAMPDRPSVQVTAIGAAPPAWRVGGVWLFSAPLGYIRDDFPLFSGLLDTLLAPHHRYSLRDDVIAHAAAHDGPYADEVERAIRAMSLPASGRFLAREFIAPQAIYALLLIEATAAAPRVSSQDGADRSAIPLALFPFTVRGSTLHDGFVFDPDPVMATLDPPRSGVAASTAAPTHLFNIVAVSSEFGAPDAVLPGTYTLPYTVIDQSGAGYRIEARFTVACDATDRMNTPRACGFATDAAAPTDASADAAPDGPKGRYVGGPCVTSADCASLGPIPTCLLTHVGLAWQDGYCSARCDPGECPSASTCWRNACVIRCGMAGGEGCRPNYACTAIAAGAYCLPEGAPP